MSVLELLLAVLLLAGSGYAAFELGQTSRDMTQIADASDRMLVIGAENDRMAKAARDITRAVDTTNAAVELGTNIVRASHKAIASIPFEVLDAIPATRATSRIVRGIHDGTSAGVYRAIFGVNKAIGDVVRDAVKPRAPKPGNPALEQSEPAKIDAERVVEAQPELVAEVVETETLEAEILRPEIVDAELVEPEVVEAELVDTEVDSAAAGPLVEPEPADVVPDAPPELVVEAPEPARRADEGDVTT